MENPSLNIFFEKNFKWFVFSVPILALILYSNTIQNNYNLDDELVTINHRNTSRGLDAISDIFNQYYYEDAMGYKYEYRPITHLSFALEHEFFGESPHVSHFINVVLYSLLCYLLFQFLVLLLPSQLKLLAWLATVIYVFHPVHTEVVASIKNRDELLAVILSIVSFIFFLQSFKPKNFLMLVFSCLFFHMGLHAKMSILPFIILIPIAIIFFRDYSISKILLHTLTFIGSYFCVFDFDLKKIYLVLVGLLLIVLLYAIKNYSHVFIRIKSFGSFILNFFRSIKNSFNDVSLNSKENYPLIYLPDEINSINHIKLNIIFLLFSLIVFFFFKIWAYLFLPLFIFMLFSSKDTKSSFVSLGICILSFLFALTFKEGENDQRAMLIFLFPLIFLVYKNEKRFNYFYFVPIISINISVFIVEKTYDIFPVTLLVLIFFRLGLKKILLSLIFLYSVLLLNELYNNDAFVFLTFFLIITVVCLLYSNLQKHFKKITLLITFLFFIANTINTLVTTKKSNFNFTNNQNILTIGIENEPNTKNLDRPLEFVEFPLGFSPSLSKKIGTVSTILGKYLKMMFIPYPMSFYYGFDEIKVVEATNPIAILSIIIHLSLFGIAIYFGRSHPILCFGIIAYLSSIVLFSNLAAPIAGMFGDRLTYVASFGFSIAIGYLFNIAYEKFNGVKRTIVVALFVTLIVAYSGITIARNAQWKNHLTLMRHDIQHLDKSAQAHNLLASNLMKYSFEKDYANEAISMRQEAIGHYKRALEIYPKFFNVWYDLGRVYMLFNDIDNAYPCFKKVNEMDSTFTTATLNLAMIAEAKNNLTEAEKFYKEIIRINPSVKESYSNLSYLYFKEGMPNESIKVNEAAINYSPQWKEPYENIIRVYLSQKDTVNAQRYYNMMPK